MKYTGKCNQSCQKIQTFDESQVSFVRGKNKRDPSYQWAYCKYCDNPHGQRIVVYLTRQAA